ncbi:hypothetical protein D3C78_1291850 [compost metagenome]
MFTRLQHHFCRTHHRLSGKFVRLRARHSAQHGSISHRFNKHKDVGRGRSADADNRVDHRLGNHFGFAKAAENIQHVRHVFRRHQRIRCDRGHARIHQRRRIWHGADDFTVVTQRARELIQRDARCN